MSKKVAYLVLLIIISMILIYLLNSELINQNISLAKIKFKQNDKLKLKENITALVFYGRKRYVQLLTKYLILNLKQNGGILDRVKFAVRTKNKQDLEYLANLIKQYPNQFTRYDFKPNDKFRILYNSLDDNEYVFKMDDDIVFIQKGTFESMLKEYVENDHLFLSANVINHPRLSDIHARMGAIQPLCNVQTNEACNENFVKKLQACSVDVPEVDGTKFWWKDTECSILEHVNFLNNFKSNKLYLYDFGKWNFHYDNYKRYSINFVLGLGKHFKKVNQPEFVSNNDDEDVISKQIPRKYKKQTFALGKAIVSHFAYFTQREVLDKNVNILNDYRSII